MSNLPALIPPRDSRFLVAVNKWLGSTRNDISTQRTYADAFARVTKIIPLNDLSEMDTMKAQIVVAGLRERYADNTVALTISAMSSLWTDLVQSGIVPDNPWRVRIKKPKSTLPARILTEEEVRAIIDAINNKQHRAWVRFLYATGLRIEEATTLKWDDIRDDNGAYLATVYGKGGKTRVIMIPDKVYAECAIVARRGNPYLIPVSARRVRQIITTATKLAGIGKKVSPHWMRHAHATHALLHGAPINVVQHDLGHASLATTGRYTEVLPGMGAGDYLDLDGDGKEG